MSNTTRIAVAIALVATTTACGESLPITAFNIFAGAKVTEAEITEIALEFLARYAKERGEDPVEFQKVLHGMTIYVHPGTELPSSVVGSRSSYGFWQGITKSMHITEFALLNMGTLEHELLHAVDTEFYGMLLIDHLGDEWVWYYGCTYDVHLNANKAECGHHPVYNPAVGAYQTAWNGQPYHRPARWYDEGLVQVSRALQHVQSTFESEPPTKGMAPVYVNPVHQKAARAAHTGCAHR